MSDLWRIPVEAEHYIPVARGPIVDALVGQMLDPGQRPAFRALARLLAALYHHEHHDVQERLASAYARFDASHSHVAAEALDEGALREAEIGFLDDLLRVLRHANYVPLTQHDVEIAEAVDFAFNLPVVIDWDSLDGELLERYFADHAYDLDGGAAPEFARKILIFRRGVGVERLEGRLLLQKLDVLIGRWIERIFGASSVPVRGKTQRRRKHAIHVTRYIERRSLRREPLGLRRFFAVSELSEPTFRELVLIYRPAAEGGPVDGPRPIRIKAFRDIPMADLEVVFPAKKLSMKPVDLIKLTATAACGVVLFAVKLLTSAVVNPLLALAALGTLGGYALKTFFGYKQSKDRYQSLVTQSLYDKSLENDRGVIFSLVDALEQQEVKEALLAYFYLLQNGPKTESEIDAIAERFLLDYFGVEVDFEADDALDKLVQLGLVDDDGALLSGMTDEPDEEIFRAVPLDEALRILDRKWDGLYAFDTPAKRPPPDQGATRRIGGPSPAELEALASISDEISDVQSTPEGEIVHLDDLE